MISIVRQRLSMVVLVVALLAPGRVDSSPQEPPSTEEVAELRKVLDELKRRIEALEASPGRPEVTEVRELLAEAEKRLLALEKAGRMPAAPPVAPQPPKAARRPTKSQLDLSPPEKPKPDDWRRFLPDFYGSLRVRLGAANSGQVEIGDLGSRVGLQGKAPLAGRVSAVGRLEIGVNVVNQNPSFVVSPDGSVDAGDGADPVTNRLGFVGVETPIGTFTYGKQWSIYYWVAGTTNNFWTFGGEAAGSFPVGDGGISGTGRAEQALNWRHRIGPVGIGVQSQQRVRTENNKSWGDTLGAALTVDVTKDLSVGAAFNTVRDGVPDPGPNEPKEGDEAAVLAVRYLRGPFQAALTWSPTRNHNVDDTGTYLDTQGWELFLQRDVGRHWQIVGGMNAMMPTRGGETEYRILDAIGGIAYRFAEEMVLTGEFQIDWSRKADGSRLRPATVFAFGMNYGW